jgi:hypothetical protein
LPANAATTDQNVSINSLDCSSAGNCTAAGTYHDSSGDTQGLLLTETGGTWAAGVEAKLPANAATNPLVALSSVSCASAGNCTAVGSYEDSSGNGQGLLLTQTSGTWGIGLEVTPPANAGTNPSAGLVSVSCPSADGCSAVGSYRTSSGNNMEALVLTETSGSWATGVELSLPADAATLNQLATLDSVSCSSAGNCTAVGGYLFMSGPDSWASQGLMADETAGSWATGVEPSLPANAWTPNPQAGLSSVSCASAGDCTAVGNYSDNSPTNQGLLLTETGGSWARGVEASLPANAKTAAPGPLEGIGSVSCASAGDCTAVGEYTDGSGNGQGLLLTETAGSWATGVEAALPADGATTQQSVGLSSVSCPSVGNCTAVGIYLDSEGGGEELLLSQVAGSWETGTEVARPANAGGPYNLTAVSCASAEQCSAVGSYGVPPGPDVEGELVAATTTPPHETLTVSKAGVGSGEVTSSPSGLDCGSTCQFSFEIGSEVTLTATASQNSVFDGWTGGACEAAGVGPCQVSITSARTVIADFDLQSFLLTVQKSGSGSGSVSSSPAGIDCGSSCAASFDDGARVTLSATPDANSTFTGWSGGGCSGTGECQLTVSADATVTANFAPRPEPPPAKCAVPRLTGKTMSAAKRAIRAHGCSVGKITRARSRTIRKGRVISQKPKPGRRLKHGARVSFVVSKGR